MTISHGYARPYQASAHAASLSAFERVRRVLLVAPTGSGKTFMGQLIVESLGSFPALWIAHRRELIRQAAERLSQAFGPLQVGIIAPGADSSPHAKIQVASVQTLIARDQRPESRLIVFDECHHVLADTYRTVLENYPNALHLGLTATPERRGGEPMGDMFDEMVVAAQYSELLRDGFIVPCRIYQPPEIPASGLANSPLSAWQRYGADSPTLAFATSVDEANAHHEAFVKAGIKSAVIEAKTPAAERDRALAAFRAGQVRVIWNVFVLTEGTDLPIARCILLARKCDHVSTYLQIVGRALRPNQDKPDAILIDLSGASLMHGMPIEDRVYSLQGTGIQRTSLAPLRTCMHCGATVLSAYRICPECGAEFPRDTKADPVIYDWALREVFNGPATPVDAKVREYQRLRRLQGAKGWSLYWVSREYRKLFNEDPDFSDVDPAERQREYYRMLATCRQKGWKDGAAAHRFKSLFGAFPPRTWHVTDRRIEA